MPNIAVLLREEITRLARKEIRSQTDALKKSSADYRKKFAEMKSQISELKRRLAFIEKQVQKDSRSQVTAGAKSGGVRFSAKGLRTNRKRLGLSASDFGKLIGVTGQTVYKWEQEVSRPREQQVAALATVRHMGKREAQKRLDELSKVGQ